MTDLTLGQCSSRYTKNGYFLRRFLLERSKRLQASQLSVPSQLFVVDWFHRAQSGLRSACPKAPHTTSFDAMVALCHANLTERVWDLDIATVEHVLMNVDHPLEQDARLQRELALRVHVLSHTRRMYQMFPAPDSIRGIEQVDAKQGHAHGSSAQAGRGIVLQGVGCSRGVATGTCARLRRYCTLSICRFCSHFCHLSRY